MQSFPYFIFDSCRQILDFSCTLNSQYQHLATKLVSVQQLLQQQDKIDFMCSTMYIMHTDQIAMEIDTLDCVEQKCGTSANSCGDESFK